MKEAFEAIFKSSKERIRNPLIFSFIISWIVYNWNWILIMLYSNLTIEEKIDTVKPIVGFWKNPAFWQPLLFASVYVFLLPYVFLGVDLLTNHSNDKRKKAASVRRVQELNHSLEVVDKEVELEKRKTEFKEVSRLNEQIRVTEEATEHLRASLHDSMDKLLTFETENKELKQRIIELEVKVKKESAIKKINIDEDEQARLRNRFSLEVKAMVEKVIIDMSNNYFNSIERSTTQVATKFLSSLDELRPVMQEICDRYAQYEDVLLGANHEVVKLMDGLEDNINDHAKRIIANMNNKSSLNEALSIIFAPILSALSPK